MHRRFAAVVSVVMLTAACQSSSPTSPVTTVSETTTSLTTPASAPSPTPSTKAATHAPAATITMSFAGDVHFEGQVANLLKDPTPLRTLAPTLGAADFTMVNLETAVTTRGSKIPKSFNFRAPATALTVLQQAGVDAVSLANNHAADYGAVGLQDTLAAKRNSPIPMVGIGNNEAEAFTPAMVTVKGLQVAMLASLQLHEQTSAGWAAGPNKAGVATNLDMTRLRAAVRKAAKQADLVVVMMHWGTDYTDCADAWQQRTAEALQADGADLIVGGHAHRLQGSGWAGRSYVAYGLGNFIWWKSSEPDSRTGILTVTVDADRARRGAPEPVVRQANWEPMLVSRSGVPTQIDDAAQRARLQEVWDRSVRCSSLRTSP